MLWRLEARLTRALAQYRAMRDWQTMYRPYTRRRQAASIQIWKHDDR
jgi:hypothetical protein